MARFMKYAIAILVSALALTGCGKSLLEEASLLPEGIEPIGWTVVDRNHGDVVFDDGTVIENQEVNLDFLAEDTIKVDGTERFAALEDLYTETVTNKVQFQYNYGKVNTLTVKGLTLRYSYNGKTYDLPCLSELAISGEHSTKEEVTSPAYYELSETIYSLLADGKEVLSATQVFEVEEGYVPPTVDHIEWWGDHLAFRREAQMQGGMVNIFCDNLFWAAQRMTDSSLRNEVEIPYVGINTFEASVPELIKVEDVAAVSDSTFYFEGNVADICGYELSFVPSAWEIEGEVTYDGIDFASELDTCYIYPRTITFYSADSAVVKFYNDDPEDYAELSISILVVEKENPLDHVEWGTRHIEYAREAAYADGIAIATCNNLFSAVQIMTNGERQNAEEIPYNCNIKLSVSAPKKAVVASVANEIGKSYAFIGGKVAIGNAVISIETLSSSVEGEVVYQGKDYASEITPCGIKPWMATVTSANTVLIKLYNGNDEDYAEFEISLELEEEVLPPTVVDVILQPEHVSFRREATVANGIITVVCDNIANFADIYSDGSRRNVEEVSYTVSNKFAFNAPAMKVDELSNVVGRTFTFSNGVVTVAGQTVSAVWKSAMVDGKVMHGGKDYASEIVPCKVEARTITFVSATEAVVKFYDNDANDYAEATVSVSVSEKEATFDHVEWDYKHLAFRREATVANGIITVVCDNIANFADIYSDGSRQNVEEVDYTVSNKFDFNAPAMKVDDINTVVGRTFTFSNGTVNVAGQTVSAVWKSAMVDGKVMHNGKDYASEIVPCKVEAKSITFVSANQAVIRFYDNNANDYAEATVTVTIEENRRLLSTDDSYNHVAFRRNAEVSGRNIAVTCDNMASFVDNYSDGTTESENVNYNVVNNFSYVVPTLVVNNIANLLGQSYSFNAGTAVVEGVNVRINFVRREVSAIMHNGKDYRSNAPKCEVEAKTLTITSATTAVVRFYDNNAADYSEAIVPITVEEQATVVDVARSYAHIAFRQNAVVANNTISVICDNKATETKTWSNGTKTEASVNYTVTNRFVYSMPMMPASAKGKSYNFNAGTAVVEGYNVNVNFSSREVSAIMFDGVDYRSEAPVCEVNVATITFGNKTATITFEEGNETIVAAVPVDYIEGEVVVGEIVGMWITDSYQGRTYVSTDLHILARQANGTYVAYSRNVNETSFSTTVLTAEEGNNVLSSGRAMAWAKPGTLGTVSYVKSDKSSTGYVIMYYYLNGNGANILGDAEAALNGVPFAEPVKAIGAMADGMWSISYNGTTYYFVSK